MSRIGQVVWLDDDSSNLGILRDIVEDSGVQCYYARSVREAVSFSCSLSDRTIDLLILDPIVPVASSHDRLSGGLDPVIRDSEHFEAIAADLFAPSGREIVQGNYSNLESRGLLFLKYCEDHDIRIRRVLVVSYVGKQSLGKLGYDVGRYINKLELPEEISALEAELLRVRESGSVPYLEV